MSEQQPAAQQKPQREQRGFGRGGGGRPGGKGGRRQFNKGEGNQWNPLTKLGRLVKLGKIETIEEIFRFSIPIKEFEIVDHLLKDKLKEEVMQVKPVQKQTCAGQRTRFQAYVVVGDSEGHVGLGWKKDKEVQGAIKGAISHAKLNLIPVRRGYWGNKIGSAHTVPCKVTGKCGSVRIRFVPAPRGTGLVAAPAPKKVLQFAGIGDVYTSSRGCTRTKGNFLKATYDALEQTYLYMTPDFWGKPKIEETPFEVHQKLLKERKQEKSEKPERHDREDRQDRRERHDKGDRFDRPRHDRSERTERPEKVERTERTDKVEKP